MRCTSRFGLLSTLLFLASDSFAQEVSKTAPVLPQNVKTQWDKETADRYAFIRTDFDVKTRKVTFLLVAKTNLVVTGYDFDIHLFDADQVRLQTIEPNNQNPDGAITATEAADQGGAARWYFVKGERLRVSFELPQTAVWDRVRHAVIGGSMPSE